MINILSVYLRFFNFLRKKYNYVLYLARTNTLEVYVEYMENFSLISNRKSFTTQCMYLFHVTTIIYIIAGVFCDIHQIIGKTKFEYDHITKTSKFFRR